LQDQVPKRGPEGWLTATAAAAGEARCPEARQLKKAPAARRHDRIFTTTIRDADMAGDGPGALRESTLAGADKL
jgi:hypothetical protein